jgi:fibronectin type 3 domain-containing protein
MTTFGHRAILCIAALVIAIACWFGFHVYHDGEIILEWNANRESDVAGYKVYYGTAPRNYPYSVIAWKDQASRDGTTRYRLKGLKKNRKYYIAVTAFSQTGRESAYSSEVEGYAR